MKNIVAVIFFTLFSAMAIAQTQQGYVKTKGRLGSNGFVISGTRLSGATVIVKGGNAVVSGNNGLFSLAVPKSSFYLQSVQKQGYVLTDPDVLSKQYTYSKNPLVLVLETPDKQLEDRLEAMEKIRSTLQKQLVNSRMEIKTLKEQNKLTKEEYQNKLKELFAIQENNEKLINEMAECYSKIDYDQLDEFNAQISKYILRGELQKADSLLSTKGDIPTRIARFQLMQEQNAKEDADIKKRLRKLEKRKELENKELSDLAQDCYNKFEISKMQHQVDSALFFIVARANLDTMNVTWTLDAGTYIYEYLSNTKDAAMLFERALRIAEYRYGENSMVTAECYDHLSEMDFGNNNFEAGYNNAVRSLKIASSVLGDLHPRLASRYGNIGHYYWEKGNYDKAKELYDKALNICLKTYGERHLDTSISYNNLGSLYDKREEWDKALFFFQKSLGIRMELLGEDNPKVAVSYNNIGGIYAKQKKYEEAINFIYKSLQIRVRLYGESHPSVATCYNSMGYVCAAQQKWQEAIAYYHKALTIRIDIWGKKHSSVATVYNNIGNLYASQSDFPKAIKYLSEALDIKKNIYGENSHPLANTYVSLGNVYGRMEGKKEKALLLFQKALDIYKATIGENNESVRLLLQDMERVRETTVCK